MLRQQSRALRPVLSFLGSLFAKRSFTSTGVHQKATVINGSALAARFRADIARRVADLATEFPETRPGLAVVQVGLRDDSSLYVRMKERAAAQANIAFRHITIPLTASLQVVKKAIDKLNRDPTIHGIIVQLPLPSHLSEREVVETIDADKDVDGFHSANCFKPSYQPSFVACTPRGCMELLKHAGVPLFAAKAVVLGRSEIVGRPMASALLRENCTVTVCHRYSEDVAQHVATADIVISATGVPHLVRGSWIKPGAAVVDVGICSIPDPQNPGKTIIVGDCVMEECSEVASVITSVPGGVGPMTVAMLLDNTLIAFERSLVGNKSVWALEPLTLEIARPVPSDLDIVKVHPAKPILRVAEEINLYRSELEFYGDYRAKVSLNAINRLHRVPNGKYVCVTGMSPTSKGEGKTTTVLGLSQALTAHMSTNAVACIRQPSQGPMFGVKGGAAGGGYSQVIPMVEFNLHNTGDFHAVTAANNLLAAAIDARQYHEAILTSDKQLLMRMAPPRESDGSLHIADVMYARLKHLPQTESVVKAFTERNIAHLTHEELSSFIRLNIDKHSVFWRRCVDTNDRFLRELYDRDELGYDGKPISFDITAASEVMSILALSNSIKDMNDRLARITFGFDTKGNPLTASDLGVHGAMAVLMKDALQPTLMQTLEGTPVFVHGGSFANVSIGCSSVLADLMASKLVGSKGYVVTEAGFGSDIGLEKFVNIKCRSSGLVPSCLVLVVTLRAIKMHGSGHAENLGLVKPATNFDQSSADMNLWLTEQGARSNMTQHIRGMQNYGVPIVVAVNYMQGDSESEINLVKQIALDAGAHAAVVTTHYEDGGAGAVDLGKAVMDACEVKSSFKMLYADSASIEEKINAIVTQIYGGSRVIYSDLARRQLRQYALHGWNNLPVCIAKTSQSFSGNPKLKGAPSNFDITVSEIRLNTGAGFVTPVVGLTWTMPGLGARPLFFDISLDDQGKVYGLS